MEPNSIMCFIPAKGNSTRIPRKNLRECNGLPLVLYPYRLALFSECFKHIVVSSESTEVLSTVIADSHSQQAVIAHKRNPELSEETSSVWDTVKDALRRYRRYKTEYVMLLHPTSPCLRDTTVFDFVRKFLRLKYETLVSVSEVNPNSFAAGQERYYDFGYPPPTQNQKKRYVLNNAMIISDWARMSKGVSIYSDSWAYYTLPADESVDIDTETDLKIAEAILQWRQKNEQEIR